MVTALVRMFGSSERIVREPIRRETLEAAITTAVKRSDPVVSLSLVSPSSVFLQTHRSKRTGPSKA